MQKSVLHTAMVCLFAFLGGFASEQFFHPGTSQAQMALPENGVRSAVASSIQVLNDYTGHKRIDLDASGGQPVQDFYGQNGTLRLQLGTYGGTEKEGAEAGLPLVGLSDKMGRLRMLMRLAMGANQSPVLVMKDSKGKDRIVMGTSLNGDDEEPFLAWFDKSGAKHMVFGSF